MKTQKRKRKQKARAGFAALGGSASPVEFNINEYVLVKLTAEGRKIHHANYDALNADYGGKLTFGYTPPKEKKGWSRWQAWDLMKTFGPHISMGFNPPFEPTIKVMLNAEPRGRKQPIERK